MDLIHRNLTPFNFFGLFSFLFFSIFSISLSVIDDYLACPPSLLPTGKFCMPDTGCSPVRDLVCLHNAQFMSECKYSWEEKYTNSYLMTYLYFSESSFCTIFCEQILLRRIQGERGLRLWGHENVQGAKEGEKDEGRRGSQKQAACVVLCWNRPPCPHSILR